MSQPSPSGKKRILSIDGGGFRGLGCLLVIQAIMDAAHKLCRDSAAPVLRPCEIFDLICGSSTGGLLAILLGRLGLDCAIAIEEYRTLAGALFTDKASFMDIVTGVNPKMIVPDIYDKALEALVAKYGNDKDELFCLPNQVSSKNAQTIIITIKANSTASQRILSWKFPSYGWSIHQVARQTTAAPIYLSPYLVPTKRGTDSYIDAAYSGFINPTAIAVSEARSFWKSQEPVVLLSIGQEFSEIAAKEANKDPKLLVSDFLSGYSPKSGNVSTASSVVDKILNQALKAEEVHQTVSTNSIHDYFRLDPPLGIGKWELVDYFCPEVEANVKGWLASPDGVKVIGKIAETLVIPIPTDPADISPPPPPPGTNDPNEACLKPRPKTIDEYLRTYHVIFVIDDSTSMVYYGARWEEARDALKPIADFALEHKADTIDMHFLNSSQVFTAVQSSDFIIRAFDQTRPPDVQVRIQYTPTGACLQRILNDAIGQLDSARNTPAYEKIKPFDIILLTDGDPSDDPKPVLEDAWARLQANGHHPNYVGIQIVQIGNDLNATSKLKDLMSGNIGSIVDTVPYNGVVTPEKLQRILLGGVQPNVRALYS